MAAKADKCSNVLSLLVGLTLLVGLPENPSARASSPVSPVLEYICRASDGKYFAHFGYKNPNTVEVSIPVGQVNRFYGGVGGDGRGQPIRFHPGRHYNVFTVELTGASLVWHLNGKSSTAGRGASSRSCANEDVKPVLESVCLNEAGSYTAHFGYEFLGKTETRIQSGNSNRLVGTYNGLIPGLIEKFRPGRFQSVFRVDFPGDDLVWVLNRRTATANGTAADGFCDTIKQPVSPALEYTCLLPDGRNRAHFGYMNPNAIEIHVPIGPSNFVQPELHEKTQGHVFLPGRQYNRFHVEYSEGAVAWTLFGKTQTSNFSINHASCVVSEERISPVLESVCIQEDGIFVASFGYSNPSGNLVHISNGTENRFIGTNALDMGQPESFQPGRHRNVFQVAFDGGEIVWSLNGKTSTASASTSGGACSREVFVGSSGNDLTGEGSRVKPFRTIQKASLAMKDDQGRILVLPGTLENPFTVVFAPTAGTIPGKLIVEPADGPFTATLRESQLISAISIGRSHTVFRNFRLISRSKHLGQIHDGVQDVVIENCIFSQEKPLFASFTPGSGFVLGSGKPAGVNNVVIRDCIFFQKYGSVLRADSKVQTIHFIRNRISMQADGPAVDLTRVSADGIFINNNSVWSGSGSQREFLYAFKEQSRGVSVNLNCRYADGLTSTGKVSNWLNTNSLDLPGKRLFPVGGFEAVGSNTLPTCFDEYAVLQFKERSGVNE